MAKRRYAIRPIRVEGDIAIIPLTQGKVAIIDAADIHLVEGHNWYAWKGVRGCFYARRNAKDGEDGVAFYMHKVISGIEGWNKTDHEDGDGLNNRRRNLRSASDSQNAFNTKRRKDNKSGVKGVCFDSGNGKWLAQLTANGRNRFRGLFDSKEEAAAAYAEAARIYHGEFMHLG